MEREMIDLGEGFREKEAIYSMALHEQKLAGS